MADYQIVCVRKPNRQSPLEHITHVGLQTQAGVAIYTREQIIGWIRRAEHRFFTSIGGAPSVWVEVVENPPLPVQPYIRTRSNTTAVDNLLSLPECP